jgi:hypothetical protein
MPFFTLILLLIALGIQEICNLLFFTVYQLNASAIQAARVQVYFFFDCGCAVLNGDYFCATL